jgi:pyridoxine 4-dehydrogenase
VEDNLSSLAVEQVGVVNLRLMDEEGDGDPEASFEAQLAAMIELRDEGKIGAVGLSNVTPAHLRTALAQTEIACVQNQMSLLQREAEPLLELCHENGVAFVPFFPLGSAFPGMPKVGDQPAVREIAERLDATPAQIGLAWLLERRPNVLLIPGTSALAHLEENLAAGEIELDARALADLEAVRA